MAVWHIVTYRCFIACEAYKAGRMEDYETLIREMAVLAKQAGWNH